MHDTGSGGWCTGMTQRDGMGREVRRKRKTGKKQTHSHCIKAEKEDTEHVLRAFMSLISYPSNLSAKRP